MKKSAAFLSVSLFFFLSCKNGGKDSVEKADSANEAKQDTALNNKKIVIDDASAAFLVRAANFSMAEMEMAAIAQQKAVYQGVKDYAGTLLLLHSSLDSQIKKLGFDKNIVLPLIISDEKKKDLTAFQKETGKNLDKAYIGMTIKSHGYNIDMFQKELLNIKDPDINSLADKALPILRAHLDSAKAVQKKYW